MFTNGSIPNGQGKTLPKNKGDLEGAKNGVFNNLIRAAYEVRCTSPIMVRPDLDDDGNVLFDMDGGDDVDGEDVDGDPPRLIVEYPPQSCPIVTPPRLVTNQPPSYFMSTEYMILANESICGTFNVEFESMTEQIKEHADSLVWVLRRRLGKHI